MKKLTKEEEKKNIELLSEKKLIKILSYNYLTKRFKSDSKVNDYLEKLYESSIENSNFSNKNFEPIDKVVIIVGAGASLGAGLMLGDWAKNDLINMITGGHGKFPKVRKDVIVKELKKNLLRKGDSNLALLSDDEILKDVDFETLIETLSQFKSIDDEVRNRLIELFRARHNPILTYEIIAHMFKYKMIDGIINYNFDELLDQSIEEELINDRYAKVIGGNDFSEFYKIQNEVREIKDNGKSSLRYYLKPHGTFSDPESLRSTKESYINNLGFNKILREELKGKVAFIVIGFDMKSVELNNIISENSKKGLSPQFFIIKPSVFENLEKRINLRSNCYEETNKKGKFNVLHYPYQGLYNSISNTSDDYDDKKTPKIFEKLFDDVRNSLSNIYEHNFKKTNQKILGYPIWNISRHVVINRLFSNLEITDREKYMNVDADNVLFEDYFYLRTLVEILIAIGKGRSMINVFGLSKGRVGLLYELYFRYSSKPKSLFDLCNKFNLINPTYSQEVLQIVKSENPYLMKKSNLYEKDFVNSSEILLESLLKELDVLIKGRVNELRILESKKETKASRGVKLEEIDIDIRNKKRVIIFIKKFKQRIITPSVTKYLINYSVNNFSSIPEIGHLFPTGNHLMFSENCSLDIYSYEQMTFHMTNALNKTNLYDTILFSTNFLSEEWLELFKQFSIKGSGKVKNKGKKIEYIIENSPINRILLSQNQPKKENKYSLDWWKHKRCAFILVKNKIPFFCAYYYHGSKSQLISPVVIEKFSSDTKIIIKKKNKILESIYQNYLAYKEKSIHNKSIKELFDEENGVNLIK